MGLFQIALRLGVAEFRVARSNAAGIGRKQRAAVALHKQSCALDKLYYRLRRDDGDRNASRLGDAHWTTERRNIRRRFPEQAGRHRWPRQGPKPQPPKVGAHHHSCSEGPFRAAKARPSFRSPERTISKARSYVFGVSAAKTLEVRRMTTVKGLAIVALLLGGTSLAIAQNGPASGGQPPTAAPAAPGPPGPGVIPHDAPAPQAAASSPYMQSAAPPTGTASGTRIVHRTTSHKHMYMSAGSSPHKKLKTGLQLPKQPK